MTTTITHLPTTQAERFTKYDADLIKMMNWWNSEQGNSRSIAARNRTQRYWLDRIDSFTYAGDSGYALYLLNIIKDHQAGWKKPFIKDNHPLWDDAQRKYERWQADQQEEETTVTLITEQDIRDTLNAYADDGRESTLHEAYDHLTTALAALEAGLQATPGPINASPFADLSLARAHLKFALSAWD